MPVPVRIEGIATAANKIGMPAGAGRTVRRAIGKSLYTTSVVGSVLAGSFWVGASRLGPALYPESKGMNSIMRSDTDFGSPFKGIGGAVLKTLKGTMGAVPPPPAAWGTAADVTRNLGAGNRPRLVSKMGLVQGGTPPLKGGAGTLDIQEMSKVAHQAEMKDLVKGNTPKLNAGKSMVNVSGMMKEKAEIENTARAWARTPTFKQKFRSGVWKTAGVGAMVAGPFVAAGAAATSFGSDRYSGRLSGASGPYNPNEGIFMPTGARGGAPAPSFFAAQSAMGGGGNYNMGADGNLALSLHHLRRG